MDDELEEMLSSTLPENVPTVFISAVTGRGLSELKDLLWTEMNSESNKIAAITTSESIVHHAKDYIRLRMEMEAEGENDNIVYVDEEYIDDIEYDDLEDFDDFEYEVDDTES